MSAKSKANGRAGLDALFDVEGLREIPVDALVPSPTGTQADRRATFDKDADVELMRSVRSQGVLMPVLARPTADAGRFEIVAGERRWSAAKAAGLMRVPCLVRALSDEDALVAQLAENLQRTALDPLVESRAYAALRQSGLSAEEIASRLGRSRSTVYDRLKLADLGEDAKTAFRDGTLSVSVARVVARLPPELQTAALEETMDYTGEPLEFDAARANIEATLMRDLGDAPFGLDDGTLPGHGPSGSCEGCPWRQINTCANAACYADRASAWGEREIEAHNGPTQRIKGPERYKWLLEERFEDYRLRAVPAADRPLPTLLLVESREPLGAPTLCRGWPVKEIEKLQPRAEPERNRRAEQAASRQRYLRAVFDELTANMDVTFLHQARLASRLVETASHPALKFAVDWTQSTLSTAVARDAIVARIRETGRLEPHTALFVAAVLYGDQATVGEWQTPDDVGGRLLADAEAAGVDLGACKRRARKDGK